MTHVSQPRLKFWTAVATVVAGLSVVNQANGQDAYDELSATISATFPAVKSREKSYLSEKFIPDFFFGGVPTSIVSDMYWGASQKQIKNAVRKAIENLSNKLETDFEHGPVSRSKMHRILGQTLQELQAISYTPLPEPCLPASEPCALATSSLELLGYRGVPIQKNVLLLQLEPSTKADDIHGLLDKFDLTVVSGIPEIGLLIIKTGKDTRAAFTGTGGKGTWLEDKLDPLAVEKQAVLVLRDEPIVRAAALNLALTPTLLPPATETSGQDRFGTTYYWDWREDAGSPSSQARDGTWGQKLVRFPAAWNFIDAIKRLGGRNVEVGVLDVGFGPHEDLRFKISAATELKPHNHGNHVVGIIAAKFGNGIGVNGGTPFVNVTASTVPQFSQPETIPGTYAITSAEIATLIEIILENPDLKVINISLGYNWVPNYGLNPNSNKMVQELVRSQGLIVRAVADLAAKRGIIIVSAAGNDTDVRRGFAAIEAQYASPFNWAAMNPGISDSPASNIIVVESIGRKGIRSTFSNVGGHFSAPGENILSTVVFRNQEAVQDNYAAYSGTSMAAPQATALIALLYSYNPDLTMDQVLEILRITAVTTSGAAPRIDAYAALVASSGRAIQDLADLNNDGAVNMADFTIFRAALRQVENPGVRDRQDLNGDGKVSDDENIFPRADLNGSGKLSRDPSDKRPINGKLLSDLNVMMQVWNDPSISAASLPGQL